MKKQTLFTIVVSALFFFILPFVSNAQTNYEDVVYLKNGSIIHGMIIEQVPNVSIKIQTADRNVFVFKIEEIEKITKEPVPATANEKAGPNIGNIKQKGITGIMEFGMNRYDFHEHEISGATSLDFMMGYLFNPNISLCGGTGLEIMNEHFYLPLYADVRCNFMKKAVTPFVSAQAGYGAILSGNSSYGGGLRVRGTIGIKFFVSPKVAMNFSLGYKYQEYSYRYYPYWYPYERETKEALKLFDFAFGVTL